MNFTSEDVADKANSLGAVAIVHNDNHVTIIGKQRTVQVWTTGTVYSEHIPSKWKTFKSRKFYPISLAVEKAVELAQEGFL